MDIRTVGIVGAGQMGTGIAQVFALAGYAVLLNDINAESLARGIESIERNMERQVARGKLAAADKAQAMARIRTTPDLSDLGPMDLIIEAATEKESVKDAIFKSLQMFHLHFHPLHEHGATHGSSGFVSPLLEVARFGAAAT